VRAGDKLGQQLSSFVIPRLTRKFERVWSQSRSGLGLSTFRGRAAPRNDKERSGEGEWAGEVLK
jgi:hypothetical protein